MKLHTCQRRCSSAPEPRAGVLSLVSPLPILHAAQLADHIAQREDGAEDKLCVVLGAQLCRPCSGRTDICGRAAGARGTGIGNGACCFGTAGGGRAVLLAGPEPAVDALGCGGVIF